MEFPIPAYIQLYPTLRCNQRCSFCFNDTGSQGADMAREDAATLLDIMTSHGIGELDIMGGEPFLLDWMPDLLYKAVDRGIAVNISTNGSLLPALKNLDGINPELLTIGLSLEGSSRDRHDRLTGARNFEIAEKSLQWLLGAGLNPVVKTVVSADTADDIRGIIALLRRWGIRHYFLIHMDNFSADPCCRRKTFSYPEFMQLTDRIIADNRDMRIGRVTASCFNGAASAQQLRCAGGSKKIAVMPDGSVLPCNLFQGFPEFRLGNIFSEALPRIMSNRLLDHFRVWKGNNCPVADCDNRSACTGGCPAHGYYHFRDPEAPDLRCTAARHMRR